jgi:hypothetical protein
MECRDISGSLSRGDIPPGADEHLLVCESCAALVVRHLAAQDAPTLQVEPLLAAVEAQLAGEHGLAAWLRSQTTAVRGLLAAAASFSIVLVTAALARRSDFGDLRTESLIALLLYAAAAIALVTELIRPMHKRQRPRLRAWLGILALGMPTLIALAPMGGAHAPRIAARSGCLLLGLLVATPVLLLLRGLDRGAPARASQRLLAVAIAALVGNLALVLCCASNSAAHILRAHAPVGFALALGSLTLHRVTRSLQAARN